MFIFPQATVIFNRNLPAFKHSFLLYNRPCRVPVNAVIVTEVFFVLVFPKWYHHPSNRQCVLSPSILLLVGESQQLDCLTFLKIPLHSSLHTK